MPTHLSSCRKEADINLMYYRSRYYDPGQRRFVQEDKWVGTITEPSSYINQYAYCYNNPAIYVDPSGEAVADWILGIIVVSVVAILAYASLYLNAREAGLPNDPDVKDLYNAMHTYVKLHQKANDIECYTDAALELLYNNQICYAGTTNCFNRDDNPEAWDALIDEFEQRREDGICGEKLVWPWDKWF
jgi:RHS repeat-associated protein